MNIAFAKRMMTLCLVSIGLLALPALAQAHSPELEAGMRAFYEEDWDGSQAHFEEALKKNPQHLKAMVAIARIAQNTGDNDQCMAYC